MVLIIFKNHKNLMGNHMVLIQLNKSSRIHIINPLLNQNVLLILQTNYYLFLLVIMVFLILLIQ